MATISKNINGLNQVFVGSCPLPTDCFVDPSMQQTNPSFPINTHPGIMRVQNLTGDTFQWIQYAPSAAVIGTIPPGISNINYWTFPTLLNPGLNYHEIINTNPAQDGNLSKKFIFQSIFSYESSTTPSVINYIIRNNTNIEDEVYHRLDMSNLYYGDPALSVNYTTQVELKICNYYPMSPCLQGIPNGAFRINNGTTNRVIFNGGHLFNYHLSVGNSSQVFKNFSGNTMYWQLPGPVNVQVDKFQNGNLMSTGIFPLSSFTEPNAQLYGYCFTLVP